MTGDDDEGVGQKEGSRQLSDQSQSGASNKMTAEEDEG